MIYNLKLTVGLPNIPVHTKSEALKKIVNEIPGLNDEQRAETYRRLTQSEQGSMSSIGNGVIVPQLQLDMFQERTIMIATLNKPLNCQTLDDAPVDIICVLLSPSTDGTVHLRGLSRITRMLKNKDFCQKIREAEDKESLKTVFENPEGWLLAA